MAEFRALRIEKGSGGFGGPLAQYIVEDIYVSGVTNDGISLAEGADTAAAVAAPAAEDAAPVEEKSAGKYDTNKKISEQMAESGDANFMTKIGLGVGKLVATFNGSVPKPVGSLAPPTPSPESSACSSRIS